MATQFLRNTIFGVIAGVSTTFGNFVSGLLIARILGVEDTGAVAFVMWLATTTVTICAMGIPFAVNRYLPELMVQGRKREAEGMLSYFFRPYALVISLPVAGFLCYAAWLAFDRWGGVIPPGESTLARPVIYVLLAIWCGGQAIADYVRGFYRGMQRFDALARVTAFATTGQIALIIAGALLFRAPGAIVGYIIGAALPAIFIRDVIQGDRTVDPVLRTRIIKYSRYRWAAEVMAAFVWSRIEVFFLQMWWGSGSVGLLTIAVSLANLAIQGPLMLTWGLLPRFTEHFGNDEVSKIREAYETATRLMALLVLPACLGLAALMPELLPLLFGPAFASAVPAAIILVCASAIPAAASVGSNVLLAMDRSDIDFYTGCVGAVLAIIGGLTLIPAFGPLGAAWSRVITQLTVVVLSTGLLALKMKLIVPLRDLLRILIAAAACAVACRLVLIFLPGTIGIVPGVLAGAIVYLIGLRLLKAVPSNDAARIRSMVEILPRMVGLPVTLVLKAVAP